MAEIGVVGSAAGIISLGIQVCQGLVTYYDFWKGCHEDIARTSESITTLSEILMTILDVQKRQANQEAPLNKQIDKVVAQCKKDIGTLSKELGNFESYPHSTELRHKIKSHLRRLYYPFRERTLGALRDAVQDVRANLTPALEALHLDKLIDLEVITKAIRVDATTNLEKLAGIETDSEVIKSSVASLKRKLSDIGRRSEDVEIFQKRRFADLEHQVTNMNNSLAFIRTS